MRTTRRLWPRGRYNGRRIVGVKAGVSVDVSRWALLPRLSAADGALRLRLLCLQVRLQAAYHWLD